MITISSPWNLKEFKIYLFLYCANADFIIKAEEQKIIENVADRETYIRISESFDTDGDLMRVQKILEGAEYLAFTKKEHETLMSEVMDLFLADGHFHAWEKKIMHEIDRLICP